ncbi:MAG: hypothetical protein P1P86_11350 [Bacteroidales bacterium]|nr:hypothetical protein [Bacteroidales bacterium]
MIFLFRIISSENPDFLRDLVAEGSDTFLELHQVLQKELGYDPTQLASFFITSDYWEKEREITLIDMNQDPSIETFTMEQVTLEEHLGEPGQRLLYLFDFFTDRAFFIELIEISDEISTRPTPFIGHRKGDPPPQLALDLLMNDTPEYESDDPMDNPDNLRIDDLDPGMLDDGLSEDY